MWESRSRMISWPGRVCESTDTRLPMVPEATKSPASFPVRSADSASRRWTVGSSSQTSSPTSAFAMASRIAGVGSVRVSERRSTTSCIGLSLGGGLQALDRAPPPLRVGVLLREPAEGLGGLVGEPLAGVHLGEEEEGFGDDEGARVVSQDRLEPLAHPDQVALGPVIGRHPQFLLRQATAADVDLRQGIGRVPALRVLLHEPLE